MLAHVLFCMNFALTAQTTPHRVTNSPYPYSQVPDTLFIIRDGDFSEAERLTIQSLQGLLAKEKPRIYRDRGVGYSIWLQDLMNNYGIVADDSYSKDLLGLVTHFQDKISGYILCDLHETSSNAALSLCGPLNAIAVTPGQLELVDELDLPMIEDVISKDESWVLDNHDEKLSNRVVIYQKPEKDLFLGDYSIFANALHFFSPISSSFTNKVFSRMENNSVLLGWGDDEHETVSAASSFSIHVHPADWAVNLSTLSNLNVAFHQKTYCDEPGEQQNVHTVCFVMTDGDNIQWTLGDFSISEKW